MATTLNPSYDASASHRNLETELQRLRTQALVTWEKEARLLRVLGLRESMAVLEPGSGPGFVTEQLLTLVPDGSVTALELDPVLLEKARQYLGDRGEGRLRLVQGSILDTGLPDASFDFVVSRLIFQHLKEPVAAARELLRVLKPGGRLVIIDADDALWGLMTPALPEFQGVLQKYGQAQSARGGDRNVGHKLYRVLREAGFEKPGLELLCIHSDEFGLEPFLPQIDPDRLLRLVQTGFVSEAELVSLRQAHARFVSAPNPFFMMVTFVASGWKP